VRVRQIVLREERRAKQRAMSWAESLEIGVRTHNGILNVIGPGATMEQVLAIPPRQWMRAPNFGKVALMDLAQALGKPWFPGMQKSMSWDFDTTKIEPKPIAEILAKHFRPLGWQPIETAPRDEKPFWAYQDGRQFVALWQVENKRTEALPGFLRMPWDELCGAWEDCAPSH
jgi:hypothetical protein